MRNNIIIAAVGAFTAITYFASSVRAQSTQEFILSSGSLDVENLTIRDDYKEFFGRKDEQEDASINFENRNLNQDDDVFYDGDDGVWQISDHWELQVNEPISPPVFPAFPQPEGASMFNNIDRAELQYELSE